VSFTWQASVPILGPISMRVIDSYDEEDGRLEVRLLGIPVQRKRGPEPARGEAYRYLAEIAWVPQAILANPQLTWRDVDEGNLRTDRSRTGAERSPQLRSFRTDDDPARARRKPSLTAGAVPRPSPVCSQRPRATASAALELA
jgi:hypothetical protein